MLSASSASFLPLISVSVYGTGPGFLLSLFSSRSSGQETVNTHSTAPTHKSEQRAGIYIQISNVEGKERKDRTNSVCGTASTILETKLKCQQSPLYNRGKHWLLKDALGMITFFPPMIYIQISKKNAFYYPGDSENKQRHFTYILACCYVLAFPSATGRF